MSIQDHTEPARPLDESTIRALVDAFYTDIRADAELGPVFERVIGSDWSRHLERMYAFWNTVALHTKTFRGNVLAKHLAIDEMREDLFGRWLTLWSKHTAAMCRPDDAAILQETARGIARNLFLGTFGRVPTFTEREDAEGRELIETA